MLGLLLPIISGVSYLKQNINNSCNVGNLTPGSPSVTRTLYITARHLTDYVRPTQTTCLILPGLTHVTWGVSSTRLPSIHFLYYSYLLTEEPVHQSRHLSFRPFFIRLTLLSVLTTSYLSSFVVCLPVCCL